jgi:ribosome-associated toxin RatA of RatAB toxin-antitoxin module
VTIAASADDILAVITDLEAYPQWAEGMKDVTVIARDDDGRPTRARFEVDARVAVVHYVLDYTYGNGRLDWVLTEGDMLNQLDGSYVLDERDGATDVLYTIEADINIPVPGFLKKRAARTILETGLRGLKHRVEAGG